MVRICCRQVILRTSSPSTLPLLTVYLLCTYHVLTVYLLFCSQVYSANQLSLNALFALCLHEFFHLRRAETPVLLSILCHVLTVYSSALLYYSIL